jgi:hypothetical protein
MTVVLQQRKLSAAVVSNGLAPPVFSHLPLGAIRPTGWLLSQLEVQAGGLSGYLDETWPNVNSNSGWLGGSGESSEAALEKPVFQSRTDFDSEGASPAERRKLRCLAICAFLSCVVLHYGLRHARFQLLIDLHARTLQLFAECVEKRPTPCGGASGFSETAVSDDSGYGLVRIATMWIFVG